MPLQLAIDGDAVALATVDRVGVVPARESAIAVTPTENTLAHKIETQLGGSGFAADGTALRKLCKVHSGSAN